MADRAAGADFKTIADFRKDNGEAIRAVCRQFVELCRRLGLFTRAVVAIDGSKFKAVNNRDKNYTVAKVIGRMEQVDASIARYLRALDRADREESDVAEAKSVRLKEKIAGLRRQMQSLKEMEQTVQDAPDQQVSLTDPDARSMATSGKGTATVGYNVQIVVNAEHHLIVAHEVINQGYDRHQLAPMALKAQQATGCEQVIALADRGYFNGDQVLSCEGTGVAPVVPQDPDLWQHQARPIHRAGLHLRRREGSLHLPGGPAPDQGAGPIRSLGRHRSIPPPDRLLHLSSQAAVHRGESEAGQALETRRRPRRHAGSARPHARGDGRATTDRRTPVWNPQGLDGRHPLPDPDPRQGPNRDEPSRPGLQSQANDHHPRCGTADGGNQELIATINPHASVDLPGTQTVLRETQRIGRFISRVFPRPRSQADIETSTRSGTGWLSVGGGGTGGAADCTPAGEAALPDVMGGAAPKEQPPRKLSGKRTAGGRALWKVAGGV